MDPEAQFYPFISTAITGKEDQLLLQYFRFISFHDDSLTPPPLNKEWDLPRYP